jgi:hypothetical protein
MTRIKERQLSKGIEMTRRKEIWIKGGKDSSHLS